MSTPEAQPCPACGSDCNERDELIKAEREIERLTAERDALRADAERYRWLREHGETGCTEKDGYGGRALQMGADLDAAIDAARAQTKENGNG